MGEVGGCFARNPVKTILFIVLSFLLLIDMTVGTVLSSKRKKLVPGIPSPYYHHDLQKKFRQEVQWGGFNYTLCTNSLGFIDSAPREVELEKKAGTERLLFIGDSFLLGSGFPYGESFIGIVTEKLGRENYEVLNAGVGSYAPRLYYLKVKHLLEKVGLKFDRLYVFIDISDIQDEISYELFTPDRSRYTLLREVYFLLRSHSAMFPFLIDKFKPIHNILALTMDEAGAKNIIKWKDEVVYQGEKAIWTEKNAPQWRDKGLALARENITRLCDLCKSRGIPVTIAVYPWPTQVRAGRLDSLQAVFWKRFAEENGTGFIDYFPYFIGKGGADALIEKHFIKGDVHWNRDGNRLVADVFLDRFKKDKIRAARPL